jgi:hypothetical protein
MQNKVIGRLHLPYTDPFSSPMHARYAMFHHFTCCNYLNVYSILSYLIHVFFFTLTTTAHTHHCQETTNA